MGPGQSVVIPIEDWVIYVLGSSVAAEAVAIAVLARAVVGHRHGTRTTAKKPPVAAAAPKRAPPVAKAKGGDMEDVFLLHRSGLLLKHYTRRLRPNMDSDVLSGMLVAVQEFIKDSFRGEGGSLDEIRFGEMRIKVLEGKWTIIASLIRGQVTAAHAEQMRAALRDLETRYEDLLIDWDGTMDRIPEVDRIMTRLVDGDYRSPVATAAAR